MVEARRDELFSSPMERVSDFNFGRDTARVFDDMLGRSVPFYEEVQHMMAEIAHQVCGNRPRILDLGCSTATTLCLLGDRLRDREPRLVGLDNSPAMLEQAREKLEAAGLGGAVELLEADLNDPLELETTDLVILNLTLQFVRPLKREGLIRGIHESLTPGGALILVEKVLGESSLLNRMYVDLYHEFKQRKGYSELEVSQKREALENVLIPYRISENVELLNRSGFDLVDVFFRWYNFAGFLAVKR